ncbi:MAG: PBSX family phage terminase large subunit [Clostridiales bacterium]|nr:PBSX family phage terminase large subunit [Clostridiales bacterium]
MPRLTLRGDFINRVYRPHLENDRRYQIYFGGAGSGKSVFLATRCVLDALRGRNTLIVRHVARTLKSSSWNEVIKAIHRLGLSSLFHISKSESIITARNNGAQILFAGLDDVEKIKSLTPAQGALTDIWMEEATECAWQDFKQLDKRLRGRSRFKKRFTLSFNPVYREHWIYREFFHIWQDGKTFAQSESVSILKTTYLDNRFLAPDDKAALENEKDPYFYQVYTLGNWGVAGDVIFTNWRVEEIGEDQPGETRMGLDFGFSSDPCGFLLLRYDRKARKIYVLSEICEKHLTNLSLSRLLMPYAHLGSIACDSAEPKSIAELRSLGLPVYPARKGADSILHGVQWLRQQQLILSPSCRRLREELSCYQWQKDRDGHSLPHPQDRDNHLIDAMRYALEEDMAQRRAFTGDRRALGL